MSKLTQATPKFLPMAITMYMQWSIPVNSICPQFTCLMTLDLRLRGMTNHVGRLEVFSQNAGCLRQFPGAPGNPQGNNFQQ